MSNLEDMYLYLICMTELFADIIGQLQIYWYQPIWSLDICRYEASFFFFSSRDDDAEKGCFG